MKKLVLVALLLVASFVAAADKVKPVQMQFTTATGTPVVGKQITIVITTPKNQATTYTVVTDSNGWAMVNYRLKKGSPIGTYQVQASFDWYGIPTAASTTFEVVR